MRILLVNDDGPFAAGLCALRRALSALGEVTVVCPAQECSGAGHAITYMVPVRPATVQLADGGEAVVLNGTPADCVKFALLQVLDTAPDLVVSGPNLGVNVGMDVFYSGTVAAAVEAGFYGLRSVALSSSRQNADDVEAVAREAVRVLEILMADWPRLPCALNVNVPRLAGDPPKVRFTRQSAVPSRERYALIEDARGRTHYWLESDASPAEAEENSDVAALAAGKISVTPLRLNLTDGEALSLLRRGVRAPAVGK